MSVSVQVVEVPDSQESDYVHPVANDRLTTSEITNSRDIPSKNTTLSERPFVVNAPKNRSNVHNSTPLKSTTSSIQQLRTQSLLSSKKESVSNHSKTVNRPSFFLSTHSNSSTKNNANNTKSNTKREQIQALEISQLEKEDNVSNSINISPPDSNKSKQKHEIIVSGTFYSHSIIKTDSSEHEGRSSKRRKTDSHGKENKENDSKRTISNSTQDVFKTPPPVPNVKENSSPTEEENQKNQVIKANEDVKRYIYIFCNEKGITCPICFEPWGGTGNHRICCLSCGHLFGKHCIERWLKSQRKCPQCNAKAKKTDIRLLYIPKITVVDSHEMEYTIKQLKKEQKERTRLEAEKSRAVLECKILTEKLLKLQKEVLELKSLQNAPQVVPITDESTIERLEPQITTPTSSASGVKPDSPTNIKMSRYFNVNNSVSNQMYSPPTQSFNGTHHTYKQQLSISVEGARVLEWSNSEALLVVTHSKNMNHGIKKFSALNPEHCKYIELHTKPVRDIRFSPNNDGIIMSVSLDKTLKLTSTKSENIILSYGLEHPSFSCCWNQTDPNYFFCENKAILMFDIRKTNTHVAKMFPLHPHPLHSLFYISKGLGEESQVEGLISGSCGGICFWDAKNGYNCVQLPLEGTCTSVSYDSESQNLLSSFRSTPSFGKPSHTVFEQKGPHDIKLIRTLHSNSSAPIQQQLLARSLIFTLSSAHTMNPSPVEKRTVVAAGDETTFQPIIWDVKQGNLIQTLPAHSSPISDIKHFGDECMDFFASLSEKQLIVYKLL